MSEDPVDLDEYRGMAAQRATENRREHFERLLRGREAQQRNHEELGRHLEAGAAETWPEVAAKTVYLLRLFAITPEGHEPRCRDLIVQVMKDLEDLCEREKESS